MENLISVIVPVYNVENYVSKCIDSILRQTYKNLEIILVDDGSTDRSGAICDEYALKDNRIRVIHKENEGLSGARNTGLALARGRYIGFADSDDWLAEDMYGSLFRALTETNADIAVCGHYLAYATGETVAESGNGGRKIYNRREAVHAIVRDEEIHSFAWDKLYKKELFDGIKYPAGRYVQDIFTTYRLFMRVGTVVRCDEPKYYYYQRGNSIQRTRGKKLNWDQFCVYEEQMEVLREDYPELREFLVTRAAAFCVSAYNALLLAGEWGEEDEKHAAAMRDAARGYRREIKQCGYRCGSVPARLYFMTRCGYSRIYPPIKKCWDRLRQRGR